MALSCLCDLVISGSAMVYLLTIDFLRCFPKPTLFVLGREGAFQGSL